MARCGKLGRAGFRNDVLSKASLSRWACTPSFAAGWPSRCPISRDLNPLSKPSEAGQAMTSRRLHLELVCQSVTEEVFGFERLEVVHQVTRAQITSRWRSACLNGERHHGAVYEQWLQVEQFGWSRQRLSR